MIVFYVILGFLWAWCVGLTVLMYSVHTAINHIYTSLDNLRSDLMNEKMTRIEKDYENGVRIKDLKDRINEQMRN